MNEIKVVSFDVWGTIIRNRPEFRTIRSEVIGNALECDPVTLEKLSAEVDSSIDRKSDQTGKDFDCVHRLRAIASKLDNPIDRPDSFYEDLEKQIGDLFVANPPYLMESNFIETLSRLKSGGIKIALLSNTGFISGKFMRAVLKEMGVMQYVDHTFFSNEVGVAKPHRNMFESVFETFGIKPSEMLHVGDNIKADYCGALGCGVQSVVYDPRHETASVPNISRLSDIPAYIGMPVPKSVDSLYDLEVIDRVYKDKGGKYFDAESYSKFKYGSDTVAKEFGVALAKQFIEKNVDLDNFIIVEHPRKYIPKGASAISKHFQKFLNNHQFNKELKPVTQVPIIMESVFEGDYGTFSEADRDKTIRSQKYFTMSNAMVGKKLVIIDDIRITGRSEDMIFEFLSKQRPSEIIFLYVAMLNKEQATKNPEIESEINHVWMNGPDRLLEIMNSNDFALNARVAKYVLSLTLIDLKNFLMKLNYTRLEELFNSIISDGYYLMDKYRNSCAEIGGIYIKISNK